MCSYIPLLFQTFDDMSLTDFFTTLTVLHLSVAVRPKDTLTFGDLKKNWIEIYFARCQILFLSLNQFGIKYYFGKWVTRNMFLNMDVWEHGWKVQKGPFVTWQCLCRERWSFFPQSLLLLKEPTISHKCVLHPTHHRCHQRRKYAWYWYLGEISILLTSHNFVYYSYSCNMHSALYCY